MRLVTAFGRNPGPRGLSGSRGGWSRLEAVRAECLQSAARWRSASAACLGR